MRPTISSPPRWQPFAGPRTQKPTSRKLWPPGRRVTVREGSMAAFLPPGSAVPPCVETRFWLCPSGLFACKTLLIGSELGHSPVPALLPFPIRAAPLAAGSSADRLSQASDDNSHFSPQVLRPPPAARWPRQPGPTPAKGFQDLSTAAHSGAHFPPAIP